MIVFFEGPFGSGKTTLATITRDQLKSCSLIKLAGINDITTFGKYKNLSYHRYVIDLIYDWMRVDDKINIIFDRSWISDLIYAELYKEYSYFQNGNIEFNNMNNEESFGNFYMNEFISRIKDLSKLIRVKYILVHPPDSDDVLKNRLERDKIKYVNIDYSVLEVRKQESLYYDVFNKIIQPNFPDNVIRLVNDEPLKEMTQYIKDIINK